MVVNIKRPKAVVLDILGTASKSGFLEQILFPYLKANLDTFITTHWTKRDFLALHSKIVEQSKEINKQDSEAPVVQPHEANQARQSLSAFITYVTDNGINCPPVTKLRFKVWFEGYNQGKLRTPIYSDVPAKLRLWYAEGIKFFVFSNTWVEAQKELLRVTNHGDLTTIISGHFDNDFGLLTEPDSWRRLASEVRIAPNDILFLTKAPNEGRAAAEAGINVCFVLTHRHNVKAVTHEDRQRFPYVRTLDDLNWLEGAMLPASPESSHAPADAASSAATAMPTAQSAEVSQQQPLTSHQAPSTEPASAHSIMPGAPSSHGSARHSSARLSKVAQKGRSSNSGIASSAHSSHPSHSKK